MSYPSGIAEQELLSYGLLNGTDCDVSQLQTQAAANLAAEAIEDVMGTYLVPKLVTERHSWPLRGRIQLSKDRVLTTPTVTARHDYGNCDCTTTDSTGCVVLLNPDLGIASIRECSVCGGASCSGNTDLANLMGIVTYHAGLTSIPVSLKMALTALANEYLLGMLGVESFGVGEIESWRSMDYAETRKISARADSNPFGKSGIDDMVWRIVKRYQKRAMICLFSNTQSPRVL